MSKRHPIYYPFLLAIGAILQIFTFTYAQAREQRVTVLIAGGGAEVSGSFTEPRKNLSFILSAAGVEELGKRISDVELTGPAGDRIPFRKIQDGEYLAETEFTGWKYRVDLKPPTRDTALAHVSWLGGDLGLLMMDDLLPLTGKTRAPARLMLELPAGWETHSTESRDADGSYLLRDPANTVFFVGHGVQRATNSRTEPGIAANAAVAGKFHFAVGDVLDMAGPILAEYKRVLGDPQPADVQLNIVPFPRDTQFGTWQAETRGRTVTIVSSDMAFRTQSLQRLHEQLRHELFHIWIPNGVSLSGRYDWFFEGFALYQSLRTGVAVNRISFGDFLTTLSNAYAIDKRQRTRSSMIDASRNRWAAGSTELYARGILIAFAADMALMNTSGGKRGIGDILGEVYRRHSPPAAPADGNDAVIAVMGRFAELEPLTTRYIKGSESFDIGPAIGAAGLELTPAGTLSVVSRPNGKQKAILDELGYNNWRRSRKYKQ